MKDNAIGFIIFVIFISILSYVAMKENEYYTNGKPNIVCIVCVMKYGDYSESTAKQICTPPITSELIPIECLD